MIRQNIWRMLDFVIVLGTAIGYLSSSSVLETVAKVGKRNFFNKLPSTLTFDMFAGVQGFPHHQTCTNAQSNAELFY